MTIFLSVKQQGAERRSHLLFQDLDRVILSARGTDHVRRYQSHHDVQTVSAVSTRGRHVVCRAEKLWDIRINVPAVIIQVTESENVSKV